MKSNIYKKKNNMESNIYKEIIWNLIFIKK